MAIKLSTGLRNAAADGIGNAMDTTGRINVYTGTPPANPQAAATGTLLATLTMAADAFGVAATGAIAAGTITGDSSADATGTAGWFRMYKTIDTAPNLAGAVADKRIDGTVTATAGGGDITFDSVSFVAGGAINMTGFTLTVPE